MNKDLGFTGAEFGFGASVFFVGYMLLEVPSNMMLHRLGARIWIARILLTWGAVATAMALVWNTTSFYLLRFGLGIAEAGFLPGLALYLTYWFPGAWRARAVAGYIIAGQVAAVIGGPLSTAVMTWGDGVLGLHGWQWMFVAEGVPTMLIGVLTLVWLTDRPAKAAWLSPQERTWLEARMERDRLSLSGNEYRLTEVVKDARIWSLAVLFGCALVGVYGLLIWTPQIIHGLGMLSDIQVGLLSAVPALLGAGAQVAVSVTSDRTGDRKFHLAGVYAFGAVMLVGSALTGNPVLAYVLLCLAAMGIYAGNPLFWSLGSSFMTGAAAAASIALINTTAQFGGLIGPYMIGRVKDATGSFTLALLTIAGFLVISALIGVTMRVTPRRTTALPPAQAGT